MTWTKNADDIPLLLRPHHLLCLQNYRGRGYSESFTDGMNAVALRLRTQPETLVRITEGADTLCRSCPNRRGRECLSCRPALFDKNVRQTFQIRNGNIMSWKEAEEIIAPLTGGKIRQLCPSCQWQNICLEAAAARG